MLSNLFAVVSAKPAEKLQFIFDIYDFDGSGSIEKHEFALVIQSSMDANAFALSQAQIDMMTNALFEEIDTDKSGTVSFDELSYGMAQSPRWLESMQLSASKFLRPPNWRPDSEAQVKAKVKKPPVCPPRCFSSDYIRRHPRKFIWMLIYIGAVVGFYLYGAIDSFHPYHREVKGMYTAFLNYFFFYFDSLIKSLNLRHGIMYDKQALRRTSAFRFTQSHTDLA